ncbi:acriflavine resistance protein B [Bordetella pertussis]|nr:acriflavine resistance protein B [Bordetella pertussis]
MAKFFIDRPVFAWVIAIVLMMAGALSILSLPVAQYPNIAPPAISINVTYPGASAQTVQDTVVQVIEQQMNGIDNLQYISSESNSDGSMSITLTFSQGTNPDTAQVQVQNKLAVAQPLLPLEVQQQGIRVTKATRHAHMDQPRETGQFRPDRLRRHHRDPRAERAGLVRAAGRPAGGARPAAQRHGDRTVAAADPGSLRPHPAQGQ